MSDTPTPTRPARAPRSKGARIALLVTGAVSGLIAIVLLAAGGLSFWAQGKKDDQGYLTTGSRTFTTRTAALATEKLAVDLDAVTWVTGSDRGGNVRLKVAPATSKPVFVGIARTSDVAAYLRGVAHTTVTDVSYEPFRADYRDAGGARRATPPAARHIWSASAQGQGTQTMRWKLRDGQWSIVVMNADGSPGVTAGVDAGAKAPYLPTIGWSALGGGLLLLAGSAALITLGVGRRRPPHRPSAELVPAAA